MSIAPAQATAFYREVAKSRIMWAIKDSGGFPAPVGNDGNRAMPFWSSESRALKIIQNVPAYRDFTPVAIEWQVFCERWVPGLTNDGLVVGVNWSGDQATGFDIAPAVVQENVEALENGI